MKTVFGLLLGAIVFGLGLWTLAVMIMYMLLPILGAFIGLISG